MEVQRRVLLTRMRPAMQRARYASFPNPPTTLRELTDILQNPRFALVTMTEDGQDSIYAASVDAPDDSHHIIFASRRMLVEARNLRILFGDGTRKTKPATPEAVQIFVVVGNWNHHIIPVLTVLMENMTEVAYTAVFRVVGTLLGGAPNLERVITDFERGQRNAWVNVFPQVPVQGCFFHLVRAYVHHAKYTLNLFHALKRDPFKSLMRMCCALPLLPLEHIQRGFELIMLKAMQEGRRVYRTLRPFFNYLLTNWINNRVRRRWMCLWKSDHRTNNSCESYNRAMKNELGVHPNIYRFIGIVTMEQTAFIDVVALHNPNNPNQENVRPSRARRPSSLAIDRRIRYLNQRLENPPGAMDDAIQSFLGSAVYTFMNLFDEAVDD